ncbi:MAG: dTMP kinase [Burkholderiales bacterium]
MNRRFITLEGIDGAGKSTQLEWMRDFFSRRGEAVITREPGGTPLGEKLREILLAQTMHAETEALLMFAARRDHLEHVIVPALNRGAWVVSDRFSDASYAYQGGGKGVPAAKLKMLELWVHEELQPGLTLLFDCPADLAKSRLAAANDRFEREGEEFFQRVRRAYLDRAAQFPQRFRIVDSSEPQSQVRAILEEILSEYCA